MKMLPWLVDTPANFNERCKELPHSEDAIADALALASCELNLNQAYRLHRVIEKSERLRTSLAGKLEHFKLGIVSNGTLDLLLPMLAITALRRGVFLEIVTGGFDQSVQDAMDPLSAINQAKPDAVLLALDFRAYPFGKEAWAASPLNARSEAGLELLNQIRTGFRSNCGALCILQTLAMPPRSLLGSLDSQVDGLLIREIAEFNRSLTQSVSDNADVLLDVAAIVGQVGSRNWFDERQWLSARIPIAHEFGPLYCEQISRVVAALRGKTRKCLVLDLDNTLWGGVIGDDGIGGIVIGQGNPTGEAHLDLQKYALELKSRGIILAVCSKNDDAVARSVFRDHGDMLLKESDFAIFVANWDDKASNIRHIASSLNIGLDAIVFVDDNPAERDIVRRLLPEVAVPELPHDPALVTGTVAAAGYFDMVHLDADDALRSEQYAANTKRQDAMQAAQGVEEFLASLQMTMSVSGFDAMGRKRITQLINKTNQFNLTTKRYTEPEIEAMENSDEFVTLQARLTDRFGDNGMISVVICRVQDDAWLIDSWLMSCRVIKRRVEEAICDVLVRQAKQARVSFLRGIYRPSERNALVRGHYESLGFVKLSEDNGTETWELEVASYVDKHPPIEIDHPQRQVASTA
ncbi:MAG: HAD-IIIC family phosphatase [Pseudomonadales bacterium]|nr:HAD family hydrolase [Halioglobus sp.]MCP5129847.1 HAD-IIIC family phosphatase [Pseudomonadales bacterium]